MIFPNPAIQKSAPSRGLSSLVVEACSVERYVYVQKLLELTIFVKYEIFGTSTIISYRFRMGGGRLYRR